MKKGKIILKIIIFVIIGIVLLNILTTFLLPEWVYQGEVTLTLRGMYNEPKNTMDAVFLGDSTVYKGISPLEIWNSQGITSYCYASPGQKLPLSYYLAKEFFEYQSPKVLFLEVNQGFDDSKSKEKEIRKVLDNMKWGKNKLEALKDPWLDFSTYDKFTYFFPIVRYHSRWNTLKENDCRRLFSQYNDVYKGYQVTARVKSYTPKDYMKKDDSEYIRIGEKCAEYMEKIKKLCEEHGTKLVLLKLPSPRDWSYAAHEQMQIFAEEHQLDFIDMNEGEEVKVKWEQDYEDEGFHMNVYGARKVSNYLGKYLKEKCGLEGHKEDSAYTEKWDADYQKYLEGIAEYKRQLEEVKKEQEKKAKQS